MWTWFLCDLEVACARAGLQRPPRRVSVLSARARSQSRCGEERPRWPHLGGDGCRDGGARRLVRDPTIISARQQADSAAAAAEEIMAYIQIN